MIIKSFVSKGFNAHGMKTFSYLLIPSSIASIVYLIYDLVPYIQRKDLIEAFWGIFGIFVMISGLVVFIGMLYGGRRDTYFVDLFDDKFVGYTLSDQRKVIWYNEIVSITRDDSALSILINSILITSKSGLKARLSVNIDDIGTCVEMIRERATNVVKVDYGGLDKNESLWHGDYDKDLKKW